MTAPSAWYRVSTPPAPGGSAIAVIDLHAGDAHTLDETLARLALPKLNFGDVRLSTLPGGDRGLVARWSQTCVSLMPHGSAYIVRELIRVLEAIGVMSSSLAHPRNIYPEAIDHIEACMLDALAHAASPLAVDVLMRQRDLWRSMKPGTTSVATSPLDHLLSPPTVVLVGRPNVGKSTLTNALAGRSVSVVSPEAGTTRDHVGVMLDFAGLVVRWIDTPGLRHTSPSDPVEHAATLLALDVIRSANLIVLAGDAAEGFVDVQSLRIPDSTPIIRVGTRTDLGEPPTGVDVRTSAARGEGLDELAITIRRRLIPDDFLDSRVPGQPWRFHPALVADRP